MRRKLPSWVTMVLASQGRHFDAFMWLLFGKDVMERKDYEIKTIVDGKPLQHVNAEVTGVLVVDGEVVNCAAPLLRIG